MIKKRKDNGEIGSPEEKGKIACDSNEKAQTAPNEPSVKPGEKVSSEAQSKEGVDKNSEAEGKDSKKEPTEADVFKFYLKQSLDEVKKLKDENETLKSQVSSLETQLKQSVEKIESIVAEYDNYRRRTTPKKRIWAARQREKH